MSKIIFIYIVMLSSMAFCADAAVSTAIPYKTAAGPEDGIMIKIVLSFIFVSMLGYFIVLVIKKYYYGKPFYTKSISKLNILEVKRVSPRLTLFRIEINDKDICLAQTDNALIILDRVELDSHHEEDITNTSI